MKKFTLVGALLLVAHVCSAQFSMDKDGMYLPNKQAGEITLKPINDTLLREGKELYIEWVSKKKFSKIIIIAQYGSHLSDVTQYTTEDNGSFCWKIQQLPEWNRGAFPRPLRMKIVLIAYDFKLPGNSVAVSDWLTYVD